MEKFYDIEVVLFSGEEVTIKAFSHNDECIHDYRFSECSRFEVDENYYQLSKEELEYLKKHNEKYLDEIEDVL